jgi:hypothetical protein
MKYLCLVKEQAVLTWMIASSVSVLPVAVFSKNETAAGDEGIVCSNICDENNSLDMRDKLV